ncbi:MAG: hypothetical protein BWY95_02653 [Bacteroidetes bacterium ADurb.BinA104]|nr:MAG: hypothetical protein BWY95_02653 [Bacteroidetes bacterium ADurb.BinA104]
MCTGTGYNTVSQLLTEVDIVVRINGEIAVFTGHADFLFFRYYAGGKHEVHIAITILDIHLVSFGIIGTAGSFAFNAHIFYLPVIVTYFCATGHIHVVVTFIQIVSVQII